MYTIRRISSQLLTTLLRRPSSSSVVSTPATPAETVVENASTPDEGQGIEANLKDNNDGSYFSSKDALPSESSSDNNKDGMLLDLPYTLDADKNVAIDAAGYLRAFVVEDEVHEILRSKPEIAVLLKSLELVVPALNETSKKTLDEWALTIESLENLERVAILSEVDQVVAGSDILKAAAELKRLRTLELTGVDVSEEVVASFEGSGIRSIKIADCPTRVSAILSKLKKLTSVSVLEKGDHSVGCDYLNLLSVAEAPLTSVSITLRDSTITLDDFLSTFQNTPLSSIQCTFATSDETLETIEQRLGATFPLYAQTVSSGNAIIEDAPVSTQGSDGATTLEDMEMEMGVLKTSSVQNVSDSPRKASVSRTSIVEKAKEAMRISEMAAKEKSKISSYRRHLKR